MLPAEGWMWTALPVAGVERRPGGTLLSLLQPEGCQAYYAVWSLEGLSIGNISLQLRVFHPVV